MINFEKIITLLLLLVLVGCAPQVSEDMTEDEMEQVAEKRMETLEKETEDMGEVLTWRDVEVTNVLTGEKFMISDFEGTPVLVESFAVWCPTCRKQQDKIKDLHEIVGDSIISISLDTDPNEDAEQVASHASRYGFDWHFVVSPVELTKSLIDEFGIGVVNAPQAPVVLVCKDQTARLLPRGIKDANELQNEIEEGC